MFDGQHLGCQVAHLGRGLGRSTKLHPITPGHEALDLETVGINIDLAETGEPRLIAGLVDRTNYNLRSVTLHE